MHRLEVTAINFYNVLIPVPQKEIRAFGNSISNHQRLERSLALSGLKDSLVKMKGGVSNKQKQVIDHILRSIEGVMRAEQSPEARARQKKASYTDYSDDYDY